MCLFQRLKMTFRANHLAVSEMNSFPEIAESSPSHKCWWCEMSDSGAFGARTAAPTDSGAVADRFHRIYVWLTVGDCRAVWLFAGVMELDLMDIGRLEWLIRRTPKNKRSIIIMRLRNTLTDFIVNLSSACLTSSYQRLSCTLSCVRGCLLTN